MTELQYSKLFDPQQVEKVKLEDASGRTELYDDEVYVFDDEQLVLSINVALATGRPLLILGPPGSGKSTLAANVARLLGVEFHSAVITGRTEARDLLWRFDAIRRLSHAQAQIPIADDIAYTEPGVLWRAFEAETHVRLGGKVAISSVVLLDEIDKADPDLPNSLLVPLGSWQFEGPDGVRRSPRTGTPLVVITSNNERSLSRPFLRRCVIATLSVPDTAHLVRVAVARFGGAHRDLYEHVARLALAPILGNETSAKSFPPSTAEFLDAVTACLRLDITPADHREWGLLAPTVLNKPIDKA